ncbi:hypothetical protein PSFL111601_02980 [Pseudomonas floridensis]
MNRTMIRRLIVILLDRNTWPRVACADGPLAAHQADSLLSGISGSGGQLANLVSHDGKASSRLARSCRFDRSVQRQQETWWQSFSGPFLYYSGRRYLPTPLKAFIEFVKARQETGHYQ